MTDQSNQPEKIAEVVRLAMLLARGVLATLFMPRTIPTQNAIALAEAAQLLRNHDAGWPPLLSQVIYELGGDRDSGLATKAFTRLPGTATRSKARQP